MHNKKTFFFKNTSLIKLNEYKCAGNRVVTCPRENFTDKRMEKSETNGFVARTCESVITFGL